MDGFQGKTVVITGGTSGIGASLAFEYAKSGAKVFVCGRNPQKLEAFVQSAEQSGFVIDAQICDISDENKLKAYAAFVQGKTGNIDIWVNNAGIVIKSPLMKISLDDWNKVLNTNLTATLTGSRTAARYMAEASGGCILNISSFTALIPTTENGAYSVSKAGVLSLTRLLAAELAPHNIRVNAIIPGYIRTDMGNMDIGTKADEIIKPIALRRFGEPKDIASGALFLTSENAGYITGEALVISGGKFIVQNPWEPWKW